MKLLFTFSLACVACVLGYRPSSLSNHHVSRREVFAGSSAAFLAFAFGAGEQRGCPPAWAFAGGGSSAYSGRTPASKAALQKSYKERVTADVRDFVALGKAIEKGQTDGNEWVAVFIQMPRLEADSSGRAYAALADLIGTKEEGGGCGLLLASSFAKAGKPPDNVPAVKKYKGLAKAFDPIQKAGEKGDAEKAKKEWQNASILLSEYLEAVELPADLNDKLYG